MCLMQEVPQPAYKSRTDGHPVRVSYAGLIDDHASDAGSMAMHDIKASSFHESSGVPRPSIHYSGWSATAAMQTKAELMRPPPIALDSLPSFATERFLPTPGSSVPHTMRKEGMGALIAQTMIFRAKRGHQNHRDGGLTSTISPEAAHLEAVEEEEEEDPTPPLDKKQQSRAAASPAVMPAQKDPRTGAELWGMASKRIGERIPGLPALDRQQRASNARTSPGRSSLQRNQVVPISVDIPDMERRTLEETDEEDDGFGHDAASKQQREGDKGLQEPSTSHR